MWKPRTRFDNEHAHFTVHNYVIVNDLWTIENEMLISHFITISWFCTVFIIYNGYFWLYIRKMHFFDVIYLFLDSFKLLPVQTTIMQVSSGAFLCRRKVTNLMVLCMQLLELQSWQFDYCYIYLHSFTLKKMKYTTLLHYVFMI